MKNLQFEKGECLYENSLQSVDDVKDWISEGEVNISSLDNRLLLKNVKDPDVYGDHAHWLLWCNQKFPDDIIIEWDFLPLEEPGLCMMFFSAEGKNKKDLFDAQLEKRDGYYPQYHSGDMNTYHLSYFRHKYEEERAFRTCNLRKSHGFHLVTSGADPLPPVEDVLAPYQMKLVKYQNIIQFSINELPILYWEDDGETYGEVLHGGYIGFRQMAPMVASYANLRVSKAILKESP
ncbi:hypothetical protein BTS2_1728 [Bacillus sp. TS-2]|nr:hypothetical protein BTS2_1728 [Bacillus sp. TS-2]